MNNSLKNLMIGVFAAGVTFGGASAAHAKNLCILSSGSITMVFQKAKPPKPGKAVALVGYNSATGDPIHGSAYMKADGLTSYVDVTVGAPSVGGNFGFRYIWTGNEFLAGSGFYDTDFDGVSDGTRNFTVVDCSTLTAP